MAAPKKLWVSIDAIAKTFKVTAQQVTAVLAEFGMVTASGQPTKAAFEHTTTDADGETRPTPLHNPEGRWHLTRVGELLTLAGFAPPVQVDSTTRVYSWGVPNWVRLDDVADVQFRLGHRLRNRLVELENERLAAVDAVWNTVPEIRAVAEVIDDLQGRIDDLYKRGAGERMATRSRHGASEEQQAELKAAKRELGEASTVLRRLKQTHQRSLVDGFKQAAAGKKAAVKALYAEYCQDPEPDSRLHWGSYNEIVADHETACKRLASQKSEGRWGRMRFARFDGSGVISVQVQRQQGYPARTVDRLMSDGRDNKWRSSLLLPALPSPEVWAAMPVGERRRIARTSVKVGISGARTVGAHTRDGHRSAIPVVAHRPIPVDAEVASVAVVARNVGGRLRYSVQLTVKMVAPAASQASGMVGVDVGWRAIRDSSGGLVGVRVAAWDADRPLPAADGWWADWIQPEGVGCQGTIVVPAGFLDVNDTHRVFRSLTDQRRDVIVASIADWLAGLPEPPQVAASSAGEPIMAPAAHVLRTWRNPDKICRLADDLATLDAVPAELRRTLAAWTVDDRRRRHRYAKMVESHTAARRDAYRNIGRLFTSVYGTVIVEDIDLRAFTAANPDDAQQVETARGLRTQVAPSELLAAFKGAAGNTGAVYVKADPAYTSRYHAVCSTELEGDRAASIMLFCPKCGCKVDQDVNAATVLRTTTPIPE